MKGIPHICSRHHQRTIQQRKLGDSQEQNKTEALPPPRRRKTNTDLHISTTTSHHPLPLKPPNPWPPHLLQLDLKTDQPQQKLDMKPATKWNANGAKRSQTGVNSELERLTKVVQRQGLIAPPLLESTSWVVGFGLWEENEGGTTINKLESILLYTIQLC